ncbi:MAG: efflux RND transporter permease subunit [Phycisphaeraceae bacterium]
MSLPRFGVNKPVVVNLLMLTLLVGGLVMGVMLRREFFPESTPERVLITMPYPGASPEEVETSLALKVENALDELDEVKEIRTTLSEGGGAVIAEFHDDVDPFRGIEEVRRVMDGLSDLPQRAEEITVELLESRLPVIRLALHGQVQEQALKRSVRALRDELRTLEGMGRITTSGVREYEIRVDVSQEAMLRHGLSITAISERIGAWMEDVPGGTVEGAAEVVTVRTLGVPERVAAIEGIPLQAGPAGEMVRVRDVAEVREALVDERVVNRFEGEPAAMLTVFKAGDQDIVSMANMVEAYVRGRAGEPFEGGFVPELVASGRIRALGAVLPEPMVAGLEELLTTSTLRAYHLGQSSQVAIPAGVSLETMSNLARFVEDRLELLIRNAIYGAILVFATLLLVLNWRVATWVGIGLVTALAGTVLVMWWLDITLNLLTTFGLIVVLGLLVDDAIVVAENVQSRYQDGEPPMDAAVNGTLQVLWPVTATVLTTIAAFLPLMLIAGEMGDLLSALPVVVACALTVSLVEALLILPSHMGHTLRKRDMSRPGRAGDTLRRFERGRDDVILHRIVPAYARLLTWTVAHRYTAMAAAIALLLVSAGILAAGHLPFNFLPSEDAETVIVDLRMPIGTPVEQTLQVAERIERAAADQPEISSVSTLIGQRADIETGRSEATSPHLAQIFIELKEVDQRERTSGQVIASIRQATQGQLRGVDRVRFDEITGGPAGEDISIEVRGRDMAVLQQAANALKQQLADFEGVFEIADDHDRGQLELQVELTPTGAALGFDQQDVATQLRGYLFGLEAHVYAAEEEDIDVRVRIEEPVRRSLYQMQHVWVVSPTGTFVPLSEIATVRQTTGYATLKRVDRQRVITVTAATGPGISPETITPRLGLARIREAHPGVTLAFAGRQEQMAEAFGSLPYGFLAALAGIYVILAWLFGSYLQPLLVMCIIPFSVIGVVWGHVILGFELTFMSLIGFVALSGIVVNGSLILISFYNAERATGQSLHDAMISAGRARFRPIMLTSVTTVLGLTPLMLEQSFQARFLIPMAISVAAGLLVATVLLLILLPCMTLIADDIKRAGYFLWHGQPRPAAKG